MSQYPAGVGPVITAGYPLQQSQGYVMTPNGAMQAGHNLHPISGQQYPIQGTPHYHPYGVANIAPSTPPSYSRTPSPYTPPTVPSTQHASTPSPYHVGPNSHNIRFLTLLAQWPMSGPSYPDSVNSYIANRGPMPDLNALQAQMIQINMDVAAGKYNLPNPSIANPSMIASSWSDNVDVLQTPWVVADPRIHGNPLSAPAPLPAMPASAEIDLSQGFQAYNGLWM
jgi:hypothetical protein